MRQCYFQGIDGNINNVDQISLDDLKKELEKKKKKMEFEEEKIKKMYENYEKGFEIYYRNTNNYNKNKQTIINNEIKTKNEKWKKIESNLREYLKKIKKNIHNLFKKYDNKMYILFNLCEKLYSYDYISLKISYDILNYIDCMIKTNDKELFEIWKKYDKDDIKIFHKIIEKMKNE